MSYATVIHARAKRGETELAEHWLWKMLEAGVEPNIAPWHTDLGEKTWISFGDQVGCQQLAG